MSQDRYKIVRYRPVPLRRRLLIVLLAVATAITIVLTLLGPAASRHKTVGASVAPVDVARCADGRTEGCVGGTATVIMAPTAPARPASAP